jgi:hypothetical protein
VRKHLPEARVVALRENLGYCGGNNRAARIATGDVLVFLNNDTEVEAGWLEPLAEAFAADPTLAAAQPKLLSLAEPGRFEYAGAAGGYLDRYGYPFCRGRLFDTVELDRGQYDEPAEILWASGAALAVRRECFREAQGFDEDFQFHMDEIDLSWRLRNLGWEIRAVPESRVWHLGAGSLPQGSYRKAYFNYRNNLFLLWKNASRASLPRRFAGRCLLDLLAAARALGKGRWLEVAAILRAHASFIHSWRKVHRKRRLLEERRRRREDPEALLEVSIVKEYFLRGRKRFSELPLGARRAAERAAPRLPVRVAHRLLEARRISP